MSTPQASTPSLSFSEQFELLDDRTISISRIGDLDLVVSCGEHCKTFRVFSSAMRLASPVWCTMLDPESKFGTVKNGTFSLEDDNLQALFIVLLACHHKHQDVPLMVDLDVLMAICVIADKYDCIGVLRLWISDWVHDNWSYSIRSPAVMYGPEWPFIAWVVGDQDKYRTATSCLISACITNDSGQCLHKSGQVLDDILPPDLPNRILQTRASIITGIIEACHLLVKMYMDARNNPLCAVGKRGTHCDIFVLGHLSMELGNIKLWPGNPQDIAHKLHSRSVEQIMEDIRAIKKDGEDSTSKTCLNNMHSDCGSRIKSAFDGVLKDAQYNADRGIELLDSHRRHLETQREKLQSSQPKLSTYQS